jgi:hypothetical protein
MYLMYMVVRGRCSLITKAKGLKQSLWCYTIGIDLCDGFER